MPLLGGHFRSVRPLLSNRPGWAERNKSCIFEDVGQRGGGGGKSPEMFPRQQFPGVPRGTAAGPNVKREHAAGRVRPQRPVSRRVLFPGPRPAGVCPCRGWGTREDGHGSRVTGHWSLVVSHWSRVTGHGLLVAGHGSRVAPQPPY